MTCPGSICPSSVRGHWAVSTFGSERVCRATAFSTLWAACGSPRRGGRRRAGCPRGPPRGGRLPCGAPPSSHRRVVVLPCVCVAPKSLWIWVWPFVLWTLAPSGSRDTLGPKALVCFRLVVSRNGGGKLLAVPKELSRATVAPRLAAQSTAVSRFSLLTNRDIIHVP